VTVAQLEIALIGVLECLGNALRHMDIGGHYDDSVGSPLDSHDPVQRMLHLLVRGNVTNEREQLVAMRTVERVSGSAALLNSSTSIGNDSAAKRSGTAPHGMAAISGDWPRHWARPSGNTSPASMRSRKIKVELVRLVYTLPSSRRAEPAASLELPRVRRLDEDQ
jgi:hypothetical protein